MPPLPAAGDVVRFKLMWTLQEDTSLSSTFYVSYTGTAPDGADCLALATDVYNQAVSDLLPNTGANASLVGCDCEDLSSLSGAHGTYVHTTAGGDATGELLPASACMLLNSNIARRYRGGKPRLYLPGPTTAAMFDPQRWTGTFIAAYQANLNSFFTAVQGFSSGATFMESHVNVSYYSGFTSVQDPTTLRWRNVPTKRVTPLVDNVINTTVNAKIGSQRRRIAA